MSLQIGAALRSGIDDLFSESGLLVTGVFLLSLIGNKVASATFSQAMFSDLIQRSGQQRVGGPALQMSDLVGPFSLDLALPVAVVLVVLLTLVGQLVKFWSIRVFADPGEVMAEDAAGRAVMALLLGGGIALATFALSMGSSVFTLQGRPILGGIFGIVSGVVTLVLGLAFVYLRQAIALYDGGYLGTVKHSVARFLDAPAEIIVLLVVLFLVGLLAGIPGIASVVSTMAPGSIPVPSQSVLQTASVVINAPVQAFSVAVITDAYLQVRSEHAGERI